jgi:hypothetical protein
MLQLWCSGLDSRRWARFERIAAAGFEPLVVGLDAAVQLGKVVPGLGIRTIGRRCGEGSSLCSETSPPEDRSDPYRFPLVALDLERMPLTWARSAGVDRPGLAPFPAPVPGEIFDGLVDIVGDGVNLGGLSGSAYGDVAELSAAAVCVEVGGVERGALAAMNCRGVPVRELARSGLVGAERVSSAVVHANDKRASLGLHCGDFAAL